LSKELRHSNVKGASFTATEEGKKAFLLLCKRPRAGLARKFQSMGISCSGRKRSHCLDRRRKMLFIFLQKRKSREIYRHQRG